MKIVKSYEALTVKCPKDGFTSVRYVLERDAMGFSLHRTVIPAGRPQHWHYTNHLEACYCVSGYGILIDLKTNEQHIIAPGTCYLLNEHDDHTFQAIVETVLISVFNPPVTGTEIHREDGSYAPAELLHKLEEVKHGRI